MMAYTGTVAAARESLSESAFYPTWAEGRAAPPGEDLDYALLPS